MKNEEQPLNYQYARGNVAKIESLDNATKFTITINQKNQKGEKIEPIYVDVLASGKKQDILTALDIKKGDFLEVDGKFSFKTSQDANKTYHTNNTIFLHTIKRHSLEKGKTADFSEKFSNVVKMKGNLTKDPKIVELENGNEIAILTVANNDFYMKEEEKIDRVSFVEISYFGKYAEEIKNSDLEKGDPLIINGSLFKSVYENKEKKNEYKASVTGFSLERDMEVIKKREDKLEKEQAQTTGPEVEKPKKQEKKKGKSNEPQM